MQSPVLPSPLCDKELEYVIFSGGRRALPADSETHSEADGEIDTKLTTTSQLPCWTSVAVMASKVKCAVFCKM